MEEEYTKNQKARFQIFLSFVLCILPSLGKASEGIIRVVPQFEWSQRGWFLPRRVSPNGEFAACIHPYGTVRVIDLRNKCLVWNIPLYKPKNIAFSPDGTCLAGCGYDAGFVLEIPEGSLRYFDVLAGNCIAFSQDSTSALVTTDWQGEWYWKRKTSLTTLELRKKIKLLRVSLSGQILDTYPLAMIIPEIIEPSPLGTSVIIIGVDGEPREHVPYMCTAKQTIDLHTKRSTIQKGARMRGYPRDRRKPVWDKLPEQGKTSGQDFRALYWDADSGICVVTGLVEPDGVAVKAWDIRKGRFLSTVGKGNMVSNVGGFLRQGVLIANILHSGAGRWPQEKRLSLIDVANNDITQTNIKGLKLLFPSPDGKYVAASAGQVSSAMGRLELWDIHGLRPISVLNEVDRPVNTNNYLPFIWAPNSTCVTHPDWVNSFIEFQYVSNHRTEKLFAPDKQRIWAYTVDKQFRKIALGAGGTKEGKVILMNIDNKELLRELKGFSGWVNAVLFVDEHHILAGDIHGHVKFWNYTRDKVLWTAKAGEEIAQFGYVPGSKFVVCQHPDRNATILTMRNGLIQRKTEIISYSHHSAKLPGTNPCLICDGSVALEAESDTIQINLVITDSGKRLLTFCALPNDQWIIYTTEGYWDGSKKVHDWVKFYRKSQLLDVKDADGFRQRDRINAILAKVFNTNRVD